MAQLDKSKARRSWRAWAASGAVLGLLAWGCLNPWPDDFPSNEGDTNTNFDSRLPSDDDDCNSNPLLEDCGGQAADPMQPSSGNDGEEDPGEFGEDRDVGADAGQSDAGAHDASVSHSE